MMRPFPRLALLAAIAVLWPLEIRSEPRLPTQTPTRAPGLNDGDIGVSPGLWIDRTPLMIHSQKLPAAAEDCAAVYDPVEHRMVLFGGKDDSDRNGSEVWALDLNRYEWRRLARGGDGPPPTEDHTLVFDPIGYRVIAFGGEDGRTRNQTWSFDLRTHRWRDMTGPDCPAREDHTAIYDGTAKRMVVFGGSDNSGPVERLNIAGLEALDLDPRSPTFEKWSKLPEGGKENAPGRSDHAAVYDASKNRMVLFGGWDKADREYLDDTWTFTFATPPETVGTWRKIKTKLSHPPKRRHAIGIYDEARNWFVICGGRGDEGFLMDVWAFDLVEDLWINITPGPQPRVDHMAIYDQKDHRLLMYGGDAHWSRKLHDLWELEIHAAVSADSLR